MKSKDHEAPLQEDPLQEAASSNLEQTETLHSEHETSSTGEASTDDTLQRVQELKDQNLRLYAEFENFRKRTARERLDLISTANESTLKALLPVLDDFDRALKMMPSEDPNVAGIVLIHAKLTETLKAQGLKSMDPTHGQPFDPEFMEAITTLVVPQPELAGTVIDELERGYRVGEKIIRYAKVVVGKAPDA